MTSFSLNFDSESLNRVCPFHLVFGNDGRILSLGAVYFRIAPMLRQDGLAADFFEITYPACNFDFGSIAKLTDDLLIVSFSMSGQKAFNLKGQMIQIGPSSMLFVGLPVITDMKQISDAGLLLSDFPLNDSTVDYLFLLQTTNALLRDQRLLADQVASSLGRENQVLSDKFRNLLEFSPDSIVVIDKHGLITLVNSQTEKMFGYSRSEIIGKSLEILMPDKYKASHVHLRDRYTKNDPHPRSMSTGLLLFGRSKDGKEFPVEISLSPVETPEGILVFSAIRDITDRKRIEHQMLQSQKLEAIGKLSAGIAHDFNNILAVILIQVDDLLKYCQHEDSKEIEKVLNIRESAERAVGLTRQLLTFARTHKSDIKTIDVGAALSDIKAMLERVLGENIAMRLKVENNLNSIRMDPSQFNQVIMNLAINARDAINDKGTLTICGRNTELASSETDPLGIESGSYTVISITDTGSGIPPNVLDKIFEPFFTTKEPGKGTGLGLATVYGIVKQAGGNLQVASEVGKGTEFTIYIPSDFEALEERSSQTKKSLVGNETIAILEDEKMLRELACELLRQNGYKVLDAGHGKAALDKMSSYEGGIDLVLSDVRMPELSGPELVALLQSGQQGSRWQQSKILYVSGYPPEELFKQGDQINFLTKPYSRDTLLGKIREILEA